MLLMGYRYYDPVGARFLTRDPWGLSQGVLRDAPPYGHQIWPWAWAKDPAKQPLGITSMDTASISWQPIAGHGSTYALACTANDRLLAGSFHAGLFHSTDTGHANWNSAYLASVGEIAIVSPTTYYVGTWYEGVLKSSDSGDSWTPITSGLTANDVYAVVVNPTDSDHLFAGTEMGLFVSQDGGANWGRPAGTLPGRLVSELAFADNVLLAVTDFGLYRSSNYGTSWLTPTTDLPPVRINVLLVYSNTVYAGTPLGLYYSTDNGDNWGTLGTGLENSDVHALAIDPADANHMVAGTTAGLFVSIDGGDTWTADTNEGLDGIASQIGALAFCPDGGDANLYVGAGGGVYALRMPAKPTGVVITGSITGAIQTSYTFTATISPVTTTIPLTYVWQATDQSPITHTNISNLIDTVPFTWSTPGDKVITVTVSNSIGMASTTHAISIAIPPVGVIITGPLTGTIETSYNFTATVNPVTTTLPLTYVWEATDQSSVTSTNINTLTNSISFTWSTPGDKIITVTVNNSVGMTSTTYMLTILAPLTGVTITGPVTGTIEDSYVFTATVNPVTATLPLTYIWQATDQFPVISTGTSMFTHTVPFTWSTPGFKAITVTVSNKANTISATHFITIVTISQAPSKVAITGPTSGIISTTHSFTATVNPITTTLPLTYVWEATDQTTVTNTDVNSLINTIPFNWSTPGIKVITATVSNVAGIINNTHTITISTMPQAPTALTITGPTVGTLNTSYNFTATVSPITTTKPLTYAWEATDQTTVTNTDINSLTNRIPFTWNTPGIKVITATASNVAGIMSNTHTITISISQAPTALIITGPTTGTLNTSYNFTATVSPITTTKPLTYVWEATGQTTVTNTDVNSLTNTIPFTWNTLGIKVITATASNSTNMVETNYMINITKNIYLPIILRNH
jgi:photosystem II stability/assembly factor-like uncharacterized protein